MTRPLSLLAMLLLAPVALAGNYAVVVSKQTVADPAWKQVVDTLVTRHSAQLIVYDAKVVQALPALRQAFPTYACFVATPAEAGSAFVVDVNRLTRQLDEDPYTDCLWGILTGYDAANALSIAKQSKPLIIRKVAAGTDVALSCCDEGVWYCELQKNRMVRKEPGGKATQLKGPDDTTRVLVDTLNDYQPDLFITSGHATERNWMLGYRYKNGFFKSHAGALYGEDTHNQRYDVHSTNPKVYLPIGNCLMGHIDSPDAMALAWMKSANVCQMAGYIVPTWYGYAGWGWLDYFVEQPGRFTLAEAYYANQQALIHRLIRNFPSLENQMPAPGETCRTAPALSPLAKSDGLTAQDAAGLLHDRDVTAFYGDPAWVAKMDEHARAWDQSLVESGGVFTLTITPRMGAKTFQPINTNGVQRGFRPIFAFLPHRVKNIKVIAGEDLHPTITDNFILVPQPRTDAPAASYTVRFTGEAMP